MTGGYAVTDDDERSRLPGGRWAQLEQLESLSIIVLVVVGLAANWYFRQEVLISFVGDSPLAQAESWVHRDARAARRARVGTSRLSLSEPFRRGVQGQRPMLSPARLMIAPASATSVTQAPSAGERLAEARFRRAAHAHGFGSSD